jgi:HSP20 family protein
MALTRHRDMPPVLESLQRLNRMLDEAFTGWPFGEQGGVITSAWFPPTDVSEDRERLEITMEIPGVRPEDVKLSLENNILTIRGEKRQETEERTERVHRYERSYGTFERTFALPSTVDVEKIEANYENGLLRISLPKAERARPREIPVSARAGVGQGQPQISGAGREQQSRSSGRGPSQPAQNRDPEEEGSAGKRP